jgi:LemA protein
MILVSALLGALVLVIALIVFLYNQLSGLRTMVREGWRGVDMQLKRRADLVPRLIESVSGYMLNERDLLDHVTELRTKSMLDHEPLEKQEAENALTGGLARLFAVVESYPDIKADRHFRDLQRQLAEIESQIQLTRRFYNGTVRNLNIAIQTFPSYLVARWFAFKTASFFEILQPAEGALPKVKC